MKTDREKLEALGYRLTVVDSGDHLRISATKKYTIAVFVDRATECDEVKAAIEEAAWKHGCKGLLSDVLEDSS